MKRLQQQRTKASIYISLGSTGIQSVCALSSQVRAAAGPDLVYVFWLCTRSASESVPVSNLHQSRPESIIRDVTKVRFRWVLGSSVIRDVTMPCVRLVLGPSVIRDVTMPCVRLVFDSSLIKRCYIIRTCPLKSR